MTSIVLLGLAAASCAAPDVNTATEQRPVEVGVVPDKSDHSVDHTALVEAWAVDAGTASAQDPSTLLRFVTVSRDPAVGGDRECVPPFANVLADDPKSLADATVQAASADAYRVVAETVSIDVIVRGDRVFHQQGCGGSQELLAQAEAAEAAARAPQEPAEDAAPLAPVAAEPAPEQPASEPPASEPLASEPRASEQPAPAQPAPVQPAPVQPAPVQPSGELSVERVSFHNQSQGGRCALVNVRLVNRSDTAIVRAQIVWESYHFVDTKQVHSPPHETDTAVNIPPFGAEALVRIEVCPTIEGVGPDSTSNFVRVFAVDRTWTWAS